MANIVLIGAGSLQFGLDTLGDIFTTPSLEGSTITLLDINDKALSEVYQRAIDFKVQHNLHFEIKATLNREEALQQAQFVIISIEVGDRFELWDMDKAIPLQYGINQIYGENGGPGGLFHSLRIVPPILDICDDVMRICPDAVVFNYSNPMSRICTTVHKKYPQLQFIGLCHEIASLERYLPKMLDMPYEDMDLLAGGLNHFSVVLQARNTKTGEDLYPTILEKAKEFFATVPTYSDYWLYLEEHGSFYDAEGSREIADMKSSREWGERRLFKFFLETFNLLPITSDSHMGEYMSWAYDVADHKGILDFYRYYQRFLQSTTQHAIELKVKERVAVIMDGMLTDSGYIEEAVNIPNLGPNGKYIEELPEDIVVEVPAKITSNGAEGVMLGTLPVVWAGFLQNQIAIHNMTAEAIVTKSKKAVVQAVLVDSVNTKAKNVVEMVDTIVEMQSQFLGYLQ